MQPIKDNKKVLQLLKREWRRAKKSLTGARIVTKPN